MAADLPALTRLIHRLEAEAKLPALELGRELVRMPQLLGVPPTVAIDVELRLLVTLTRADVVSLWRLSSLEQPEPIAFRRQREP